VIATRNKLGGIVARLGLGISLIVALGAPGGYLLVAGSRLDHELSMLAQLKANKLSKYIYVHQEMWQYQTVRLAELTEIPEAGEKAARQRILDRTGELVLETGEQPQAPVARSHAPVIVAGAQVALVETATSFRPVLIQTAIVAAFSLTLGIAIHWIIRGLLLRTLEHTLAQLEASQSRYRHVVDSMLDAVFTTDPGGVTYVSPASARVLGVEPEQIIGTSPVLLFHSDDVPMMIEGLRAAHRAPGSIQTLRLRSGGRLPEGRWLDLRFKTTGRPDAEGHYSLIGVVRDIDAQVAMERAQRDDMMKLRSIVESSGALIALIDSQQRIVLANRTFLDAVAKGEEEVIGQPYRDVVNCGADSAALDSWFDGERREVFAFDQVLKSGAQRRIVRVTASHVHDDDRDLNYSLFLGVDETERRTAEVRAIDASRLATLGEMATGIAHEINQPLTVVQFAADSMEADLDDGLYREDPEGYAEDARRHVARVRAQAQRAAAIVRRLQGFARKGDELAHPFDIAEAITGAADLVSEQMRLARISVALDLPKDLPPVCGHANRLQQVVINLMINARDAIQEDRESSGNKQRQDRIDIRALHDASANRLVVEIGDSGPGIPEHVLPRLFESFFTTKPKGKGTGLGLSISTEIMAEMNGTITAENRPQRGAVFRMSFPIAAASLSAAA
jgi:PAS domain S-box-containing protein